MDLANIHSKCPPPQACFDFAFAFACSHFGPTHLDGRSVGFSSGRLQWAPSVSAFSERLQWAPPVGLSDIYSDVGAQTGATRTLLCFVCLAPRRQETKNNFDETNGRPTEATETPATIMNPNLEISRPGDSRGPRLSFSRPVRVSLEANCGSYSIGEAVVFSSDGLISHPRRSGGMLPARRQHRDDDHRRTSICQASIDLSADLVAWPGQPGPPIRRSGPQICPLSPYRTSSVLQPSRAVCYLWAAYLWPSSQRSLTPVRPEGLDFIISAALARLVWAAGAQTNNRN